MLTQKQQRLAAKAFYQHWKDKQGYEKGKTQQFWNMLLRDIFGVEKTEDFIEYEKTVYNGKSQNYIDAYIASTQVLIEHKSDNVDLTRKAKQSDGEFRTPYEQAKHYGDDLPYAQKPRYIIACNFREFHIHDMNKPHEEPQIVLLKDLQKEYHRLSFIAERYKPAHIQKEEQLSIDAGKIVGILYDALAKQYKDINDPATQQSLNKLCVRLVFCLYAENADLFHQRSAFYDYLQEFTPRETRQALIDLFTVFNTPDNARGKLYLSEECLKFPYVNGGLFADQDIEIPQITAEIRNLLLEKASNGFDWAEISPTIFGAVFESTLNPETRRSGGMHYTSIENIYKVIKPLFLDDLIDELDDIKKLVDKHAIKRRVTDYQRKLSSLTFLDPAAGSGNFLTQTYIELRKLENQALHFAYGKQINWLDPIQVKIGQFYGIEINDFAVSVAQTALWIAEIQMKRQTEEIFTDSQIEYLPLKSFAHFYEGNALRLDWNSVIPASELNYIMGNPPFVGYSLQNKAQKDDLLSVLIDENGKPLKTAGKVDYVAGWYYKACGYMQGTNIQAAFVSTNSICQGEQPAFVFKHLKERYQIQFNFAYRTFRWDSEAYDKAAVHCVIIGFSLSGSLKQAFNPACHCEPEQSSGVAIHSMTQSLSNADRRCNDTALSLSGSLKKQKIIYDGDKQITAKNINAYLIDAPDILVESRRKPIFPVSEMIYGNKPTDGGFLLFNEEERQTILAKEPNIQHLIRPIVGATEYINATPRYCLWLVKATPKDLRTSHYIAQQIEKVKQYRLASPKEATRKSAETPHLFQEIRQPESDYLLFPRVSSERRRYIPIGFVSPEIIASDACSIIPNADLYMFGVLTSSVHMAWMRAVAGRLEMRYRYSGNIVYNNFIWCEPDTAQKAKIEHTARAILDARANYPTSSLADLYDELTMPPDLRAAHKANDTAVLTAYGLPKTITEEEIVAFLMQEYQKRTSKN